jgi:hypothetical protein
MVFKETSVTMPSSINPTYEPLDLEDLERVVAKILTQMTEWNITSKDALARSEVPAQPERVGPSLDLMLHGLSLGDEEGNDRQAFLMTMVLDRSALARSLRTLVSFVTESDDNDDRVILAVGLIEALGRTDSSLVEVELLERLSQSKNFTTRSCAANLMWDLALTEPGRVPIGLLARLAEPTKEDWYVFAPALAAAKELLLVRSQASEIFDHLARSDDPEDRRMAAESLMDVAMVEPTEVSKETATRLAGDEDESTASLGSMILSMIAGHERNRRIRNFGL